MWNLQSGKFSLVEYGTLGLEMWNPTEGIRNTGIQVLSTKNLESNNWNIKPTAWNPESKTDLDYITWRKINHKVPELHKAIISHWKHYGVGKDFFYK